MSYPSCQAVARFFMLFPASKLQRTTHRLLFPSQQVSMQIATCWHGRHTDTMTYVTLYDSYSHENTHVNMQLLTLGICYWSGWKVTNHSLTPITCPFFSFSISIYGSFTPASITMCSVDVLQFKTKNKQRKITCKHFQDKSDNFNGTCSQTEYMCSCVRMGTSEGKYLRKGGDSNLLSWISHSQSKEWGWKRKWLGRGLKKPRGVVLHVAYNSPVKRIATEFW